MLQLMQQSSVEMGLASPGFVATNQATDVVQTLALLNAVGYELQREHEWTALRKQNLFESPYYQYTGDTTSGSTSITNASSIASLTSNFMVVGSGIPQDTFVSSASGTTIVLNQEATATASTQTFTFSQVLYPPPSDYDRIVDRTQWDKSKHWEQLGPETAQQAGWLKSGWISTGPRIRWWLQQSKYVIWPPLGANEVLSYDYISNLWVTASGQSAPNKTAFTVDTDVCVFPDRLMVLGTKLKYFQIKGFDTSSLQRDYMMQLNIAKSYDNGSALLSFAPKQSSVLIGWDNIPDSGYGA